MSPGQCVLGCGTREVCKALMFVVQVHSVIISNLSHCSPKLLPTLPSFGGPPSLLRSLQQFRQVPVPPDYKKGT